MGALTKDHLERENRMLRDQLRRVETMAETWRRRKGELAEALDAVAPEVYASLVPSPERAVRYLILDRIVECATELALKTSTCLDGAAFDAELEALQDAVLANEHYWQLVAADKEAARARAAKASQTKREKEAASDA